MVRKAKRYKILRIIIQGRGIREEGFRFINVGGRLRGCMEPLKDFRVSNIKGWVVQNRRWKFTQLSTAVLCPGA